jgi:hypothetical protein
LWLNNAVPKEVCEREPSLRDHGFYRKLKKGGFEFISFCNPNVYHWIGVFDQDLQEILDAQLPPAP